MTLETETALSTMIEITVTSECLHVAGELDGSNTAILREAILAADVAFEGPIVLDMSRVEFMDSAGIGVLLSSFKSRADGVTIVHPSPAVEHILQLTGMYQRFVALPT